MSGRPRSFNTVEEMQDGIDSYFAWLIEQNEPPLMEELAEHLGIHHDTLCLYARGEYDVEGAEVVYSEAIKRAKQKVLIRKNKNLIMGKGSTVGLIFDLKNNHNWKDKTETETYNTITTIVKKEMGQDQALEAYTKQLG